MILEVWQRFSKSTYWQDILWQASGNSLAQIIGIIGIPLLTRLYTPEDFALQNLFLQAVSFLAGVITWRYEYFLQLPKEERESDALLYITVILGGINLCFFTLFGIIYRKEISEFIGNIKLAALLGLAPLVAYLLSFSTALQHKIQRQRKYKQAGISELVNRLTYICFGYLFSIQTSSLGLVLANMLGAVGKAGWLGKFSDRLPRPSVYSLTELKKITFAYSHLSLSMVYSHLMVTCTIAVPIIFVGRMYGQQVLGQFTLVISTLYLPAGLIGSSIGQVYYQRAAEIWNKGESFNNLWWATAKKLLVMGAIIYGFVALIATWAYPFIFGAAWKEAGKYAVVMTMSSFCSFISAPMDKTSLVVNAWWYLPAWHTFRALTTTGIILLAWLNNMTMNHFLLSLAGQMSAMYLVDYWVEWQFTKRVPL